MRNIYFYSFSLIFLFIAICGNIITSKSVPETVIVFVDEQDRSYTFEPCIYYWNAINHYPDFIIKKRIDDGIIKAMHLSEAHQKNFNLMKNAKKAVTAVEF